MKVLTVVGARPQFIKAAMVSHVLRERHTEVLVHTGQHFDYNMSQKFFEELDIPTPDYNLGISGGTHAQMTGNMMIAIEEVLIKEKPDWLLLFGDTNSTLAAAIAGAKLHIPICHVEAGNRTDNKNNPEEINRICTDHIASLLLTSSESGLKRLEMEDLKRNSFFVGNLMFDAFKEYSKKLRVDEVVLKSLNGCQIAVPNNFYYLTCHREENTHDDKTLKEVFDAMNRLDAKTIYPVHPRNKERALRLKETFEYDNIILCEPIGYLESVCLINNAKAIVTDSGGLQCEAFFAKKKCVIILDFVCWPEIMVDGRSELSPTKAEEIIKRLSNPQVIDEDYQPFGDGNSAKKIVELMEKHLDTQQEKQI